MKISCITPTVRKNALDMVYKCLQRQDFQDFEWIVVSPYKYDQCDIWVEEPPKKEGAHYGLNAAWNAAIKQSSGELMVSIVDLLWFPPNILDDLWAHYKIDPMSCVGGIGYQYEREENGKPEGLVWQDPRVKDEPYYQVSPNEFELCVASLPLEGVRAVGGFDEEFDFFSAMSEKELCMRMEKLEYTFWLDQTLEYRALKHPRLTSNWDERYFAGFPYFQQCIKDIHEGKRLRLDYLGKKLYTNSNGVSGKEPATL